jgi:hypothetical protein
MKNQGYQNWTKTKFHILGVLRWSGSGFVVQTADTVSGPWVGLTVGTMVGTNVVPDFEAHIPVSGFKQFFRLASVPPCPGSGAAK